MSLTKDFKSPSRDWFERPLATNAKRDGDFRTPYQRDKARILHSAPFRCLQNKTQIMAIDNHDFFRTRLTHSLEVAQIGGSIVAHLRIKQPHFTPWLPEEALMESLGLAHDIGHPPFGHSGEAKLHQLMSEYGGFEGNAQTLRVTSTMSHYSQHHGMNLTRRTLMGLLKYPIILSKDAVIQKGIYESERPLFEWILAPLPKRDRQRLHQLNRNAAMGTHPFYTSLDCAILNLADDIAYGVHDLEDAISMGLLSKAQWQTAMGQYAPLLDPLVEDSSGFESALFSQEQHRHKGAIGALVNAFVTHIDVVQSQHGFESALLALQATLAPQWRELLDSAIKLIFTTVINGTQVKGYEHEGQKKIELVFSLMAKALPNGDKAAYRQLCDQLTQLSDRGLANLYQQLTMGTLNH